jgi:hypothetical protein
LGLTGITVAGNKRGKNSNGRGFVCVCWSHRITNVFGCEKYFVGGDIAIVVVIKKCLELMLQRIQLECPPMSKAELFLQIGWEIAMKKFAFCKCLRWKRRLMVERSLHSFVYLVFKL